MNGGLVAGIFVGVALTVAAIIGVVWFYRKRSQNAESEGKIILKKTRSSESYDYLLLDKNTIDCITIDHHAPVKLTKTQMNGYDVYTDKPNYHKLRDKGIPFAVTKTKTKSKPKPDQDRFDKNEYKPCRKRNYETSNFETGEVGDGHKATKHTCRDGKYKHCGEARRRLDKDPLYEDIENVSQFTRPIRKHLAKIRPVRRPSLHSRKQVEMLGENEMPLKMDLLPYDKITTLNKHSDFKSETGVASKSVKDIVDNVKNLANLESEKPAKTFILTNENFSRVNTLRERYEENYGSCVSAWQNYNLNMSGKGRQNQTINCATIDQNKSDISTNLKRGKTTDRLLNRNTISDIYIENARNEENYLKKVNKFHGDRDIASSVKCEKGGYRISNKSVETTETRTNDRPPISHPSKANSEILPTVANDVSNLLTSEHLPLSTEQLPLSTTFITNEMKTKTITVTKAPVHKTVLQVGFVNKMKGEVSSLHTTASMDVTDERSKTHSTLPSISLPPSKLQQPKMHMNNQTSHEIQTPIDTSLDNNSPIQVSSPLLVSPVKPRPPVAPKPKTPKRMSTRMHPSTSQQSENLITSSNILKTGNTSQLTAISTTIQTMAPMCLPSIPKSSVIQTVGPSEIPTLSGVSLGSPTVTNEVDKPGTDSGKGNLHTEGNTQINVADQNDESITNNTRYVNFRSPDLCEYVLRTPSPDEPSPTDSMLEQCEPRDTEFENDSTNAPTTDTLQSKVSEPNEMKDNSIATEDMQDSLNQKDSFTMPDNFEIDENLPNKEGGRAQDGTLSSSPTSDTFNYTLPTSREDETNRTKTESPLEANRDLNLLIEDPRLQSEPLNMYRPNFPGNTSELLTGSGSNMGSQVDQASYNNDVKDPTCVNGESIVEETIEQNVNGFQSKHSQGILDRNIESFNPTSSSTPFQSQTDIDPEVKDKAGLDEGEDTFAMIKEALAKRRKRFLNESINSSADHLDQSSVWHDNM